LVEETKEERRARKALERAAKLPQPEVVPVANSQVIVLCVRFGTRYGREYVERLRNMVSRHLTIPYEFVCLTDDIRPIDGVRNIVQPNAKYAKGWWHKVHMFDPDLPIQGRILYFDLDVVIHNNINKLVDVNSNVFYGIHDFNRKFHSNWHSLNSSALCWTHGKERQIWDQFKHNQKEAMRMQGDQDWIWKLSKGHMQFWPRDWLQSYKWEIRNRQELTVVQGRRNFKDANHDIEPPADCSVTVFHGDPKPQDVQDKFVVDNWR
jgi:hypothetical protein